MGERRGTRGLELWCRKMTEGYPGVKIENMTTSWRDGLGFCAIIHHFRPDLIDFSKLNKDDIYHNNELAFTVAEQHLGIPALLEPEDMVEFPVPDRLSILTYLSQFYQAFAVGQGSPSRIITKRQSNASERGIVSPTSTSPPTKVALRGSASIHREPCAKCNLPVFIAERLNVGKLLFHRTCFRCARCSHQLTLSNYYETENNEYCCETCPDEEVIVKDETDDKFVWSRPLSDEEKSANLKLDDYSSKFETALEGLSENFGAKARSDFVQSQLEAWECEEEPPELPATKPPDLKSVSDDENKCSDSGFPSNEPIVNSVVSDDQLESAEKDSQDVVTKEESRSENAEASESVIVIDDSVITISDDTSSPKIETNPFEYPDDLNPFGDEEDAQNEENPPPPPATATTTTTKTDYDSSLNPFGSEDDEEEEQRLPAPSPKPRAKKKIKPPPEDKEISESPFNDDDEDEGGKEPTPSAKKKVIPAPRITLTPFWSDEQQSGSDKPVPLPRAFKGDVTPKSGGPSASAPGCGSNTSLATLTGKKKKPAPPPPTSDGESPFNSLTSSPSHSVQHSPGQTLRVRKTRRAPLPPTSTPISQRTTTEKRPTDIEVSPVVRRLSTTSEWENEKLLKDEENRTRQSLTAASIPNKSMYGKWKRKKGQAPSRPVPQRRTIKSLPIVEIRRELDLIEVQQQGLERQGVKLEQIIREKTEASNGDMDSSTSAEVEDMILQLFEIVNEKNELFRKQAELMYLRRQQRLEEEHANVEYQIRCLMLTPEANKTDLDKAKEEELINRLVDIVERRNEIVECLEMDRVREAEENDSINKHLTLYTSKREEEKVSVEGGEKSQKKEKKKFKKKFKLKGIKGG